MRTMKKALRIMLGVAFSLMLLAAPVLNVDVQAAENANRMNVVFVLDQSGSMANTDPTQLRYEAMDLFLGLSTEDGNYMGAVVFDHDIVLSQEIQSIDGSDAKEALSGAVKSTASNGDTNIGKAIELATSMLIKDGNPSLTSAIILLSDGNTDLPQDKTGEQMQQSLASKANAIDNARNNGIKIYSVCLNINGAASVSELQDISDSTGGTCVEVKSAADLKTVFNQFYNIIYSTKTIELADTVIGEDGTVEIPFQIPPIGVEEANIIINTLNANTTYTMFTPDGIAYSKQELEDITIQAKTFSIIKIQDPEGGDWKLVAKGIPGDQVRIDMVYNANLILDLNLNGGNQTCNIGQAVDIVGAYVNNGTIITDQSIYQSYPIQAVMTDVQTGQSETVNLTAGASEAATSVTMTEVQDVDVYLTAKVGDLTLQSETKSISVGNSAPVVNPSSLKITKFVTPLTKLYEEDLSQYVSDADDIVFTYEIRSTDYDNTVAYLDDSKLCIDLKECKDAGTMSIAVIDSRGAEATLYVEVKTISIFGIILGIILAIAAIVILILVIRNAEINSRVIRGCFYVIPFEDGMDGSPMLFDGSKGKMYLHRFLDVDSDMNIGLNLGQTYLLAADKKSSAVHLISKAGYYTDLNPDARNKKIVLLPEMEVTVSADMELQSGIRITYKKEEF